MKVQDLLAEHTGEDVWFYSITLEPERDSPEVLARYARRFRVRPGFVFLTGKPEDIELLRRQLGFTFSDPYLDADLSSHLGIVKLGNEPKGWWGDTASLAAPNQIASLLRWLVQAGEASTAASGHTGALETGT